MNQTTIKLPVEIRGIGLHSGEENHIRLLPAPPDTGILFKIGESYIRAHHTTSSIAPLCSALSNGNRIIYTVEHLLASLYGLGIDNVIIETQKEEIPILDGSALIFVSRILESGIRILEPPKKRLIIKREIIYRDKDSYAIVRPADSFSIKYTIEFKSRLIGRQSYHLTINPHNFVKEIAPARTFCELKDVDKMRSLGIIKGGSLENAIVVDDMKILNKEPLRFINEFVRHKILDAIGDISLVGYEVKGYFEFFKAGHRFNHYLIKHIIAERSNYEIIETEYADNAQRTQIQELFSKLPGLIPVYK